MVTNLIKVNISQLYILRDEERCKNYISKERRYAKVAHEPTTKFNLGHP